MVSIYSLITICYILLEELKMMDIELLNRADNDLEWFDKHYGELRERYDNKFIAIRSKKVIGVDEDIVKLVKKLKEMGENPSQTFIKHISKIERIL